jgi:hypothetical protein
MQRLNDTKQGKKEEEVCSSTNFYFYVRWAWNQSQAPVYHKVIEGLLGELLGWFEYITRLRQLINRVNA